MTLSAFAPVLPVNSRRCHFSTRRSVSPSFLSKPASRPIPTNPRAVPQATTQTPVPTSPQPSPSSETSVFRLFRREFFSSPQTQRVAHALFKDSVVIEEETCFNIGLNAPLDVKTESTLTWLLSETFDPSGLTPSTHFVPGTVFVEVGPRLNFQTAWSANAVAICIACGLTSVHRLERSRRYCLRTSDGSELDPDLVARFTRAIHDRMTETPYKRPLRSFATDTVSVPSYEIDVLERGATALEEASVKDGLGFDSQDITYYEQLFKGMGRNPTNVELFDLAQSNSEHSRHWFFKGKLIIDGEEVPKHLLDVVRDTLNANPRNSVVAFADNSSTIRGTEIQTLQPVTPGNPGPLQVETVDRDILFTAETHNFPSGVAPFPGAETGTGGRIRDTAATGIGSLVVAGTAGYAVGNLHLPDAPQPWEDTSLQYPDNLASPLDILIGASNGASDYGNKFGEPVINGFARSYGVRFDNGERREFVKPIMFSGGMGQIEHSHSKKGGAELGLLVVKVGGPAYRIGMGGGAASSMMQGDNKSELDFNAVQRGDAEMAQKVYRVLRACVELGSKNPIVSIHDQGAGGNCNVVKELIYPGGAKIDVRKVWVGDSTLSALEIWGAEYQEQFGLLLRPEDEQLFRDLCARENVVPAVLGSIDGSGRIVLWDDTEQKAVVDMDLEAVLGDLPQKTFVDSREIFSAPPLKIPGDADIATVLTRVLSLMSVGSKRFLTTKVDRSVTGLIAQQQCVGPLQLPLSDFAITAQSHFTTCGSATAIGERPSLTRLSPAAMARISVGEMMTNMAGAKLTAREDIKCEGNWMWAAKLDGDCASLYDAATSMRDVMVDLGIAIDGGKDSLSMAAKCPTEDGNGETVRAPGTLVMTAYCTMKNVEDKLTPYLKRGGESVLLHVDIARGKRRMGGGSVAQVYGQLGDVSPDLDDVDSLRNAFDIVQNLIGNDGVLAYHDISDGGLLTCVLEMAFSGNCGVDMNINSTARGVTAVEELFAEELGMVVEVSKIAADDILKTFQDGGVDCSVVAETRSDYSVSISDGDENIFSGDVRDLRDKWEATSFALERQQADSVCVAQEQASLHKRTGPKYEIGWTPRAPSNFGKEVVRPRVAIIREEGSNGDREMSAAFHMAGFEAWDVCMRDIASGQISLKEFCGAAFVGGFSFADVLDSAKGWAGVARMNEVVRTELDGFFERKDTFSLGVCNGCQLMALMGRVPFEAEELDWRSQPRFIRNESGRYESRFASVAIGMDSPAVMLRGMQGGKLGVWVAHGEGRAMFPDPQVLSEVEMSGLVALRYVDDDGKLAGSYPENPNGSTNGIAGLCSRDGRHLAMMPHPERTVLKWQWGYAPEEIEKLEASPWLTMFQNAYDWVMEQRAEK